MMNDIGRKSWLYDLPALKGLIIGFVCGNAVWLGILIGLHL